MKYIFLLASLVALVAGCGPAPGPSETAGAGNAEGTPEATASDAARSALTVAFVTNNPSDFWKIAEAGTRKAERELGCKVLFRMPPNGTAQEQQQIIQDLLAMGVAGIAISPKDPVNQTELLNDVAAKVHLITQDSDAPESNRACYIGTNNVQAGRAAAELVKRALPDGGKIALFVGSMDAQNARDRKRGLEEGLEGAGIEVIGTWTDETDRAKAMANVQDTLITHPDVGCLVGLWAYNGPAILNAVRDSGKLDQVKIVCFDEEDETLQGVLDGHIVGTIVQQPFAFGYQSVRLLCELAAGDESRVPPNKQIFIDVLSVTQEKAAAFWAQLKELTGKS